MTDPNAPLFPELPGGPGTAPKAASTAPARVLLPNRGQMEFRPMDLESTLPAEHRARVVWGFVLGLDLSAMYAPIKAREGGLGRPAIAPEILLALWLYATLQGEGSARAIARHCEEDDAYRWICGGVGVNYHTLSDFRVGHGKALDGLLSQSLASLMDAGVVKAKRVAQDGVRVRASAGAGSFRRGATLEELLELASAQVQALKEQMDADPGAPGRRKQAAQERAARECEERIKRALERLPQMEEIKKRNGKKAEQARASATDADATVMKMGDGGFRPAYNVQFATDCETQVVVGVEVSTSGSDMGQLGPMVEQVKERCGQSPEQWLVDGGYPAHEQLEAVAQDTEVYAPVPVPKKKDGEVEVDVHAPKAEDSAEVAQWRARMGTEQAKEIYKERAATAECVNAQARNRGLQRLPVRGEKKVRCVAVLFALAHNLMRAARLAPELVGIGTGTPIAAAPAGAMG